MPGLARHWGCGTKPARPAWACPQELRGSHSPNIYESALAHVVPSIQKARLCPPLRRHSECVLIEISPSALNLNVVSSMKPL